MAGKDRMLFHANIYVQITGSRSVFARLAFAGDTDGLAIMHPSGNFHDDCSFPQLPAGSTAAGTMVAKNGSTPAAIGAGNHHAEHSPESLLGDSSLATALQAHNRGRSRFSAASGAVF